MWDIILIPLLGLILLVVSIICFAMRPENCKNQFRIGFLFFALIIFPLGVHLIALYESFVPDGFNLGVNSAAVPLVFFFFFTPVAVITSIVLLVKKPKHEKRHWRIVLLVCSLVLQFLPLLLPQMILWILSGTGSGNGTGGNIDSEEMEQRIIFSVLAVVLLVAYVIALRLHQKSWRRLMGNMVFVERTPEQEELFFKSAAFYNCAKNLKKQKRFVYIRYGIGFCLTGIGLLVSIFVDGMGGGMVQLPAMFATLILEFIAFKASKQLKRLGKFHNWFNHDCIKCGGNNELVKFKFKKTDYVHEDVVIHDGSYKGDGQVVSVTRQYNAGSRRYENVAHVKHIVHYYDTTRKCQTCGNVSEHVEAMDAPPETQVSNTYNIDTVQNLTTEKIADTMTVEKIADTVTTKKIEVADTKKVADTVNIIAPALLPFVFCQFCGGKNKGEALSCEHCGGTIFKEVITVFCQKCGSKNTSDCDNCTNCNGKIYKV